MSQGVQRLSHLLSSVSCCNVVLTSSGCLKTERGREVSSTYRNTSSSQRTSHSVFLGSTGLGYVIELCVQKEQYFYHYLSVTCIQSVPGNRSQTLTVGSIAGQVIT